MEVKFKRIILTLIITNFLVIIFALIIGNEIINPFKISSDPIVHDIVFKLRAPRIIAAVFAGMTLAASGLLIQVTMRNELADSSILGFQSGATLAALIIMLVFPKVYPLLPLFAFFGGLIVYGLVIYIVAKTHVVTNIIVAGIAISSVIRSLISLVSMLFAENLEDTLAWSNGSLTTVSFSDAKLMAIYSIVLLIVTVFICVKLDLLLMDDDFLQGLGLRPMKIRFLVASLAILLASVSVSFVGTIGFVGLLAPHISRRLVGNNARRLMSVTILVGSLLVVGCDTLQRFVFPIYEIPVGTILSFVGGAFLIHLLIRSSNARV